MKYPIFQFFGCLILLLSTVTTISAQTAYTLSAGDTEFSVDGTSSLHNWTMTLETGKCSGTASFETAGNKLTGVEALNVQVETTGLKSGKGQMDDNTYKALKTDEFQHITFTIDQTKKIAAVDQGYQVDAVGRLTIAGNTQPIDLTATCVVEGSKVTCSGSKAIKMTDHGVDPPTAMFGSLKTGDDITIHFKAVFSK